MKQPSRFACEVCGRGGPGPDQNLTIFRTSPKGGPFRGRCEEHMVTPIDPIVKRISDILTSGEACLQNPIGSTHDYCLDGRCVFCTRVARSITSQLDTLIEQARAHVWTDEEVRANAISFAYGNVRLHNPAVTREMVEREYDALHPKRPL